MSDLRYRMDQVWNATEIASPCHLNCWTEAQVGHTRFAKWGLFWKHGKLLGPRKAKIKGKGFTFLAKWYGTVWRSKTGSDVRGN